MQEVPARYYDGNTAAHQEVWLIAEGQGLRVRGDGLEFDLPRRVIEVSERMGSTPRLIRWGSAGHCEVADIEGLEALLDRIGWHRSWLEHVQHGRVWALLFILLLVGGISAAYRYALPWAAEVIAFNVPEPVLQGMGRSTLETLDKWVLKPSVLDEARQRGLVEASGMQALNARIVFRSASGLGANAFALPGGEIVVLDDLVRLAGDDGEIVAVLAHELGHVERRHALRLLLQSSIVGLVLTWYVGDVSTLLAGAPAAMLQARYSREMEREADAYALQWLGQHGRSGCYLAAMLDKLERAHGAIPGGDAQQGAGVGEHPDFFASHPATAERLHFLCPDREGTLAPML